MSTLESALALAAEGYYVFPLKVAASTPAHTGWQGEATTDPDAVRKMWNRGYNIGIYTGRDLLVVDVDTKDGRNGWQAIMALELEGKELPPTREHATKSGGRHFIYRVDKPVKQGANVLGEGVDVRSRGGYIVAPGSKFKTGEYTIADDAPIAPAPQWLIDACGPADESPARAATKLPGIDPERALARSVAYLESLEPVTAGERNDAAFRAAAQLKDFGLDADECEAVMLEHWNCQPMLSELAVTIGSVYRNSKNPQGSDAPEAVFESVSDIAQNDPDGRNNAQNLGHPFAELNKTWALVMTGGGHHMLWETTDFKGDPIVEHVKEGTFHKYLLSHEIQVGKKSEKLTQAWMAWRDRRTYDGLVFAPEQRVSERWYNLWRGFNVAPVAEADASPRARAAVAAWREHVLLNVAMNDSKLARWFTGFMAHLIQKPYEKPLVALVLKGRKGTGKNAVIERVGALFARNMVVADDDRYLIGNFNSHLEACLLLALDEASWAGSKKIEGKMKGIITGSDHLIERKGMEPYKVKNLTRVVILGNEEYLVPATRDERRYAVFDVAEGNMQDRKFFQEMREGMEANGGEGYGVLLHYLKTFDLSGVDVNDAPQTLGLARQKIQNLQPVHQWWLDAITEGQIPGLEFGDEWMQEVPVNRLREAFYRYARDRSISGWKPTARNFNDAMRDIMPEWASYKSTSWDDGDKSYHYKLPPLDDARRVFSEYVGSQELWNHESPD